MSRLFGTDGVRGQANRVVTPELAFRIGRSAGLWLKGTSETPKALIARDTRRSGPMIGAALASGLCASGVDVEALGVLPTGAVSFLLGKTGFGLGAVVSASHNPAEDNGIKLLAPDGRKLPSAAEEWIVSHLDEEPDPRPVGVEVGSLTTGSARGQDYGRWLLGLVPEGLAGLTVALDAGHGAAYEVAPWVLRTLGATVFETGCDPDGMNINGEGGATKPDTILELTQRTSCQVGVAFDGDADRAVFCDDQRRLINGDRTMGIWCDHWQRNGRLDPATVVGTVMTNGGFEQAMTQRGIALVRTDVGDKHVSARLDEIGGKIGGEQSGHVIFPEWLPTGDGLVTCLELFRVLVREGRPAREFLDDYAAWPQVLVNVRVSDQRGWDLHPRIIDAIETARQELEGHGRIVVRASGTQPMIRVMVEASEVGDRDMQADRVVDAIVGTLSGEVVGRVDLTHALGD